MALYKKFPFWEDVYKCRSFTVLILYPIYLYNCINYTHFISSAADITAKVPSGCVVCDLGSVSSQQ